uniref:Uncharacterized protein n=1 Tax=Panagrolaimus sp. ES5 TaxID=591445 RepID=A0AC34FSY6_9BILA
MFVRLGNKGTVESAMEGIITIVSILTQKNDFSKEDFQTLSETNILKQLIFLLTLTTKNLVIPGFEIFYKISKFDDGIQAIIESGALKNIQHIFELDDPEIQAKAIILLSKILDEKLAFLAIKTINNIIHSLNEKQIYDLVEAGIGCDLCEFLDIDDEKLIGKVLDSLLHMMKYSGKYMAKVAEKIQECESCKMISKISQNQI